MAAERPPPPKQPSTTQLPAVTDRALLEDLSRAVREGITELRGDIQLVATDVTVVKERVRLVEGRLEQVEGRQNNSSIRARGASQVDEQHAAQIAALIAADKAHAEAFESFKAEQKRELARQTKILERLDRIAANPVVRRVAYAVATGFLAYAAARGWLR